MAAVHRMSTNSPQLGNTGQHEGSAIPLKVLVKPSGNTHGTTSQHSPSGIPPSAPHLKTLRNIEAFGASIVFLSTVCPRTGQHSLYSPQAPSAVTFNRRYRVGARQCPLSHSRSIRCRSWSHGVDEAVDRQRDPCVALARSCCCYCDASRPGDSGTSVMG